MVRQRPGLDNFIGLLVARFETKRFDLTVACHTSILIPTLHIMTFLSSTPRNSKESSPPPKVGCDTKSHRHY